MKLVSWNVNGLRSCIGKGFMDYLQTSDADIICLQETKLQEGKLQEEQQRSLDQWGYAGYWNCAEKKGYSGTAVLTRVSPLSVRYGLETETEPEGRIITMEFDAWILVNVYTPNARRDLSRLPYRLEWEDRFLAYVKQLDDSKPVVVCGDLNVAHREIDIKNARANRGNSGFTQEERDKMSRLLEAGWIDTFRHLHPDRTDAYTWWSNMPGVRARNVGWRIDYFLISAKLEPWLQKASIDADVMGSDHCPVVLNIAADGGGLPERSAPSGPAG